MRKLSAETKAAMIHDYVTTDMTCMDVARRHGNLYSSSLKYNWLDDPEVASHLEMDYGMDTTVTRRMWEEKRKRAVSSNNRNFGRFTLKD